jgi:hypothetical protein
MVFFGAPDGLEITQRIRVGKFLDEDLSPFQKNVQILNIPCHEIEKRYKDYIKINFL